MTMKLNNFVHLSPTALCFPDLFADILQIQEFARAIVDYDLHSNGLIDAPKDLADLVESIIGAVFMDCNSIDIVWKVSLILWSHSLVSLLVGSTYISNKCNFHICLKRCSRGCWSR